MLFTLIPLPLLIDQNIILSQLYSISIPAVAIPKQAIW